MVLPVSVPYSVPQLFLRLSFPKALLLLPTPLTSYTSPRYSGSADTLSSVFPIDLLRNVGISSSPQESPDSRNWIQGPSLI